MEMREITKSVLDSVGLLEPAKSARSAVQLFQTQRYIEQLVALYRHPCTRMAKPIEDLWLENQRKTQAERVANRFDTDRAALLGELGHYLSSIEGNQLLDAEGIARAALSQRKTLGQAGTLAQDVLEAIATLLRVEPEQSHIELEKAIRDRRELGPSFAGVDEATARQALVRSLLDRVCEDGLFPHSFEYDYLEDIVPIIASRYVDWDGAHRASSGALLGALSSLAAGDRQLDPESLPQRLLSLLGPKHGYAPRRGDPHPYALKIIPDLYEELVNLRAREKPERLLQISRQYSQRQRDAIGQWGPPLSLLLGYERDHHLMLRRLVEWIDDKRITPEDDVLVVGPRHRDEMQFFRRHLGLPNSIGLDLFDAPDQGIEAGDMHAMKYADGRFRLIYTCSTLNYAYDIRRVVSEMLRVLKRPGYIILSDAASRRNGVDPMGRTDPMSADGFVSCFYDTKFSVLFHDDGRTPYAGQFRIWPSVGLRID